MCRDNLSGFIGLHAMQFILCALCLVSCACSETVRSDRNIEIIWCDRDVDIDVDRLHRRLMACVYVCVCVYENIICHVIIHVYTLSSPLQPGRAKLPTVCAV